MGRNKKTTLSIARIEKSINFVPKKNNQLKQTNDFDSSSKQDEAKV
ncbi:MAG: hypothetical protein IKH86_10115 [Prevotella sp.]|nr:hypothetical protein [Prevotella sp.]